MLNCLNKFAREENGATAIEYGLIASLIAVAILGGLSSTGGATNAMYNTMDAIIAAISNVF